MSFSPNDLYRFDEFELSPSRRTLLRNGEPVILLPRTFDVLACLVENPGRVLAKEEILKAVWRNSFVEENNLTQHISLLRKALADRAGCIATIPGRGYQFTAEVITEPRDTNGFAHGRAKGVAQHSTSGSQPLLEAAPEPSRFSLDTAEPGRKPQVRVAPFSTFLAHLLHRTAR
jgi:DNA-binding winged helix-turn-helix (wHTH) protein